MNELRFWGNTAAVFAVIAAVSFFVGTQLAEKLNRNTIFVLLFIVAIAMVVGITSPELTEEIVGGAR